MLTREWWTRNREGQDVAWDQWGRQESHNTTKGASQCPYSSAIQTQRQISPSGCGMKEGPEWDKKRMEGGGGDGGINCIIFPQFLFYCISDKSRLRIFGKEK